jgi:sugar phosphate isomerase/epimerase
LLIGCHSLVFGALTGAEALREIAASGFDVAVLACIAGQAEHAAAVQELLSPGPAVFAIDAATHEVDRGGVAIAHAVRLAIQTVITAPGGRPGGRPRTRILVDAAARGRRTLAVTPRARSAIPDASTAERFVERAQGVALWPDTSHLARAGDDLTDAARALAPHSAGWFIRDHAGSGEGAGSFEAQVPGRGTLDLRGVVAALRDVGWDGALVFHAVGHLSAGRTRDEYPVDRVRALAREARDYLSALSR